MMLLQAAAAAAQNVSQTPAVHPPIQVILVGVLSALVFLLLAALIANMIKFDPGSNPKDPQKRKIWFWVLGIVATLLTFVLLYFVFNPGKTPTEINAMQRIPPAQKQTYKAEFERYQLMSGISTGITFVLYVVLGFIVSKIFKNKKVGNWFS